MNRDTVKIFEFGLNRYAADHLSSRRIHGGTKRNAAFGIKGFCQRLSRLIYKFSLARKVGAEQTRKSLPLSIGQRPPMKFARCVRAAMA